MEESSETNRGPRRARRGFQGTHPRGERGAEGVDMRSSLDAARQAALIMGVPSGLVSMRGTPSGRAQLLRQRGELIAKAIVSVDLLSPFRLLSLFLDFTQLSPQPIIAHRLFGACILLESIRYSTKPFNCVPSITTPFDVLARYLYLLFDIFAYLVCSLLAQACHSFYIFYPYF